MTQAIAGLRDVADRYDGFIVDLWGVMHDGVRAFPDAVATLRQLRARGARIVMLSNAPRRSALAAERSAAIGVTTDLYDTMITSGEDCWLGLRASPPGPRAVFIQAGRDGNYIDGLDIEAVVDPALADFLLVLGVEHDVQDLSSFEARLQVARARDLVMLCANPDLVVIHGGTLELCAGSVAQRYEAIGGRVQYHGKPHQAVYARAFDALGVEKSRILAIGDSLRTDVAGARAAGIDSAFVADGIHLEELIGVLGTDPSSANIAKRLSAGDPAPDWVMRRFNW
ncbi:MAG: TIGR01459 family HAD-type hydrolase [Rhodospirillaceae bacterium]|nr:TIGR01459 family HAD-type hydrolase [Rhodospirillaceae bacterium]